MVEPMNDELLSILREAREEVERDARHELSFRTRRRLLLAMGPQKLDSNGRKSELVPGKARRLHAAILVARRVAPAWKRLYENEILENLLELIEGYSAGRVAYEELWKPVDSLQGGLLNSPQGDPSGWLAGCAVASCGWVAIGDELLVLEDDLTERELYEPDDPDFWDAAFWAAGAAAGGMSWVDSFSADACAEYWRWYVNEVIPEAWNAY